MEIKQKPVTNESAPHRFREGVRQDITVSTPGGSHYLFYRLENGSTMFVYGGTKTRPSKKVLAAAEAAL